MLFQLPLTEVLAASALSFALFLIAAVRFIGPITEYVRLSYPRPSESAAIVMLLVFLGIKTSLQINRIRPS